MYQSKLLRRTIAALVLTTALSGVAQAKPLKSITTGVDTSAPGEINARYRNINPFYRNIGAFWGSVNPFYRNIGAFWGDVGPFYRNIGAFWGDLNPLYRNIGAFNGQIVPDYRNIGAFWEEAGGLWTSIDTSWSAAGSYAANPTGYASLAAQLKDLNSRSETYWGASVQSQTGKSFAEGFANPLLAKYGIDLNDPASLEKLPANERAHFFMDWYDGLMNFSGTDHADHWMKTINWTPLLTQTQGSGKGVTIGLVDFHIAGDADLQSKTVYNGGVSTYSNGHGAAVGSLIAGAHDGKGVMGIAPNVSIAAYNPFDATGSADWPDVKNGIVAVTNKGASVVNLSLGVPGAVLDAGWRGVFTDQLIAPLKKTTTYVIAAGNDGVVQPTNIEMAGALDAAFLVVGSVDPTGKISDFSNTPGTACLLNNGACKPAGKLNEGGLLMNRFIVAPGELILVSDDNGGTTRLSGTSFAAPLVTGAIALLHDRWPWLKQQPLLTAAIILGSAKDLGAPGIDPVYGVGLLDVEASQAPLNFNALKYYQVDGSKTTEVKVDTLQKTGVQSSWETKGLYFSAFEDLNQGLVGLDVGGVLSVKVGATKRDFLIPLSSRLVGTQQNGEYFQQYVYQRMTDWISAGKTGFTAAPRLGLTNGNDGWNVAMSMRVANPKAAAFGRSSRPDLYTAVQFASPSGKTSFTFGRGDGALEVGSQAGFGLRSDYDPQTGGVNPLLGFAAGGAHAGVAVKLGRDLTASFGMTQRDRSHADDVDMLANGLDRTAVAGLRRYRANAANLRLDYRVDDRLGVSAALTSLDEATSLLGVRSIDARDFGGGTTTRSVTLGANYQLPHDLMLSASGTASRSASQNGASLRIGSGGLVGSSYQIGLAKEHVLGSHDRLRLSVAQPLTIENGTIDFRSVEVVDRQTGEIGVVTRKFDVASTKRRFVAEAVYATSILGGGAELSAFGRGELTGYEDAASEIPAWMMGARATLAF